MKDENITQEEKRKDNGEVEISILDLFYKLMNNKKFILKAVGIGIVVGLVVGFSIPRKYKAFALLIPESNQMMGNEQMSGMASMLGLSGLNGMGRDAINITRAEHIVSSTPFLIEMMKVHVKTVKSEEECTIVDYMATQKKSWLGQLFELPRKAYYSLLSLWNDDSNSKSRNVEINPFQLTKKQMKQLVALKESIEVTTDKKKGLIEVSSYFQDPMVAALFTDSLMNKLKKYLITYKTNKAQQDYDYLKELSEEYKTEYYDALKQFAKHLDANQNVIKRSANVEAKRLQNDADLSFQIYSQISGQLQMARAKIQEEKPIFAVMQPVIVPLKPHSPNRTMLLMAFTILSFVFSSMWILFGKDSYDKLKKGIKKSNCTTKQ